MKKIITALVLTLTLAAGCAGGAGGGGLGSNAISDQQGQSITAGMSPSDVRSTLGKPESITKSKSTFMGKTSTLVTYSYGGSNDSTWVFTFTDGKEDGSSQL